MNLLSAKRRADAEAVREAMRAHKRGRNGEDRPRREKREKRPRTERVYKCRKTLSGCVAVFQTKEEREEHYAKVHNFVRKPGDLDKKKLRCPLGHCPHRYTTKPQLEEHLNAAHSKFVEVLDVPLLVRMVCSAASRQCTFLNLLLTKSLSTGISSCCIARAPHREQTGLIL